MKFSIIDDTLDSSNIELVSKDSFVGKGGSIRYYSYRLEDEEEENYADIAIYMMDRGKYSYCFMYAVPDLCTSAGSLKELRDIWESFSIKGDIY